MRLLIPALIALLIYSCSTPVDHSIDWQPTPVSPLTFVSDSIAVEGELGDFSVDLDSEELEPGLHLVKVKVTSSEAAEPPKFSLKWKVPSADIQKFWSPALSVNKANYYYNYMTASSTRYAPVTCLMNSNDECRHAVALDDALNKTTLHAYLIEEDAQFHVTARFFEERHPAFSEFETYMLIDNRPQRYEKTLGTITDWWSENPDRQAANVPDAARQPMYSTWYSYHQNLEVDKIVEECRESKKIGMEAVIVDDGWQTLDNKRGYAYCGDWKPDRIPDMAGFVQQVHDLDMDFLLWYSVPLVGKHAENFSRFEGKYLYEWESQGAWVLDPRYPEVREFIIRTYIDAQADWDLDGFKLDFMGMFRTDDNTVLTAEDGRDFASVNEAVDRLMSDIMSRLRNVDPDVMIEFRQPYMGPLMRKYGNMLRAADCPNMATINRVRTTDIRLLAGETVVHSDMFMWHPEDPVETAALQILNILWSVPQTSVRLNEIPQEHKDMVAYWIGYWNENKSVLLDGAFQANDPDALYPVLSSRDANKQIAALYHDVVFSTDLSGLEALDIVNGKKSTQVVLRMATDAGIRSYTVRDCMGKEVGKGSADLSAGIHEFKVPYSGMISFN